MSQSNDFTPAAGRFLPTSAYDRLLAVLTREARWRSELLESLAPRNGERILDVGCGTGSFAILVKQAAPYAEVVGIDPDEHARCIAKAKAAAAGIEIEWMSGFARDAANFGQFDKVVSSLVFHQVPVAEKQAGLAAMFAADRKGQVGAGLAAPFGPDMQKLSDPVDIQADERVAGEDALFDIGGQELAGIVPAEAERGLGEIVGTE